MLRVADRPLRSCAVLSHIHFPPGSELRPCFYYFPVLQDPKGNGSEIPLLICCCKCMSVGKNLTRAIYVYYYPVCLKRSLSKSFWAMGGHDYDDSISAVCERCDSNSGDRDTGARALATILCNVQSCEQFCRMCNPYNLCALGYKQALPTVV